MTNSTNTIKGILALSAESFLDYNLAELKEMKSILDSSAQKLERKVNYGIINAQIKLREKAGEEAGEQGELELVENSVKVTPKMKKRSTSKGKTETSKPKAIHKEDEAEEKPKKKKVASAPKKPEKEEPEEDGEFLEDVMKTGNTTYNHLAMENIVELAKHLYDNPYRVFAFIEERPNDVSQFLAIYSDDSLVTLLDVKDDSIVQMKVDTFNTEAKEIKYGKKTFPCKFYIATKDKVKQEA